MTGAKTDANGEDWLELAGRICVVTGAGSGIGAGTARELAANGAKVAVLDRDGDLAEEVAHEIESAGGRAIGIATDVANEGAVCAAANRVREELGSCSVLVNCAALMGYVGPLIEADLATWRKMLDVNITGALICTRAFGQHMIDAGSGGSIVNVASICGHVPLPNGGAYSITKSGLIMLGSMLALELAPFNIRCNSVSPGLVRTGGTMAAYGDPEVAEGRRKVVPIGRVAEPADIAEVIVFLASERARYVNGQDLLVDGAVGQTIMRHIPSPRRPMVPG